MSKLIIIHHEPLTQKIKRNFYIDTLLNRGVNVLYWAIDELAFGRAIHLTDEIESLYYNRFNDLSILNDAIQENKDAIFLLEFEITLKTIPILELLKYHNCKIARISIHTAINLSFKEKIKNVKNYGIKKFVLYTKNLLKIIKTKLIIQKNNYDTVDYFFYCGNASINQWKSQVKVPVNSFDYEDFQNRQELTNLTYKRYAVFLDEYLPYHPDVLLWGNKINPRSYYTKLNNLFDEIESKYDIEVVIAAHPKSNYANQFGKRRVIKYKTPELVRHCKFVICHDSLSISFAVLNYKPLFFVIMKEFYGMSLSTIPLIKKFSKELQQPCINIDSKYELRIEKVDYTLYDAYKYSYLTDARSEQLSTGDIIADVIKDSCY